MYTLESYEKLENIVNNWLNEGDDTSGTEKEVEEHRSNSKTTKTADTGKTYNKIDDAFADLENFDL
jgi:hypothetical protein